MGGVDFAFSLVPAVCFFALAAFAAIGTLRMPKHPLMKIQKGGLGALADRSRRPESCPHQVSAGIEAAVCEMRREHHAHAKRRLVGYAAIHLALHALLIGP